MSRVLTLKNLKQLALAMMLLVAILTVWHYGFLPSAQAQMIDPGDSPQNISDATGGEQSFRTLARTVINYFLFFLGFVATIMIIYGGIMYITAGGADDKVGTAKKVITYAVIGIVIILLSFTVVNTVLQSGVPGAQPTV